MLSDKVRRVSSVEKARCEKMTFITQGAKAEKVRIRLRETKATRRRLREAKAGAWKRVLVARSRQGGSGGCGGIGEGEKIDL